MQSLTTHLLQPNYTYIPNIILDEWIDRLNIVELKILLVVCRETLSSSLSEADISLDKFVLKTGYSKTSIIKAINSLEQHCFINKKCIKGRGGVAKACTFSIKMEV
jgi:hypothetical protein